MVIAGGNRNTIKLLTESNRTALTALPTVRATIINFVKNKLKLN